MVLNEEGHDNTVEGLGSPNLGIEGLVVLASSVPQLGCREVKC